MSHFEVSRTCAALRQHNWSETAPQQIRVWRVMTSLTKNYIFEKTWSNISDVIVCHGISVKTEEELVKKEDSFSIETPADLTSKKN